MERCKTKRVRFLLSTPSLKHRFWCTFVPSSTLHSLIFYSVTSHSNDSKLPYSRKNHRRTTCPPNTQVLTSSTSLSSNHIDREFPRVCLGSPKFHGAATLTVAYHALLCIPARAETSGMIFILRLYQSFPLLQIFSLSTDISLNSLRKNCWPIVYLGGIG